MSITDELREFAESLAFHRDTIDMMLRIADRIDAEHRAALEKVAAVVDGCPLEARVERIERLLNHKGG